MPCDAEKKEKTECGSVIRILIDKKYGVTLSRMNDELNWKFPISSLNSERGLKRFLEKVFRFAEEEGIIWADTPWAGRYEAGRFDGYYQR